MTNNNHNATLTQLKNSNKNGGNILKKIGEHILTAHAYKRMIRRKIPVEKAAEALKQPPRPDFSDPNVSIFRLKESNQSTILIVDHTKNVIITMFIYSKEYKKKSKDDKKKTRQSKEKKNTILKKQMRKEKRRKQRR